MPTDILTLFSQFGLKKDSGEVYLHLLQTGRRTAGEVAESLHLTNHRANVILKELSNEGLAKRISTNPETFVAAYPSALLNPAIGKEAAKLQQLTEARDTLLKLWDAERTKAQGLPVEWCPVEEGFTVLYDKDDIIDRRLETFKSTEKRLWIISTEFWLLRWDKVLCDYFVDDE